MRTSAPVRILNGYRVIHLPSHPRAMTSEAWNGYIYEHIVEAEKSIGRSLRESEVVHHLDENRADNTHQNLLVLERSQHAKLHAWMLGNQKRPKPCPGCGATVYGRATQCLPCYRAKRSKQSPCPTKEELATALDNMSMEAIGRKYKVSGVAVKKWAKKYGLVAGRSRKAG